MIDAGSPPPRFAARLLRIAVGDFAADALIPDLEDLFHRQVASAGPAAARRWYWRQTVGHLIRAGSIRRAVSAFHQHNALPPRQGPMDVWLRDLKLAIRTLTRQPGFAALAIGILALGIGANTAIFSVIYGSALRPLPYPDAARLVWLSDVSPSTKQPGTNISVPNWVDLQAAGRQMERTAIYKVRSGNLAVEDRPERIQILYVSSEMLGVLGLTPQIGRDFGAESNVVGSEPAALLSDGLWRTHFGADPAIVGQTVRLDSRPVRVVGVAPATFSFPGSPELLMAFQFQGATLNRAGRGFNAIARLAPGATTESLRQELNTNFSRLVTAYPNENKGWSTWADPLQTFVAGRNHDSLYLLGGAAAMVLLIACVNVANLLLVRAENRRRELALRYALGARRLELLSQFLSEGLVLAVAGGALGIIAAHWGVDLLVAVYGDSLPRAAEIKLSGMALAVGVGTSLAVGVLVGLIPMARLEPDKIEGTLREGSRGASAKGSRLGRGLVIAEVALAVLVVSGAGLLINSMWRLQNVNLGVHDQDKVLTFELVLPPASYRTGPMIANFFDRLVADLSAMPGVEAVGLVNRPPLTNGDNLSMAILGDAERVAHGVSIRPINPGFLAATGVPLVTGREITAAEFRSGAPVILINQTLARRLFNDADPLGQLLDPGWGAAGRLEVVGVVGDMMDGNPGNVAPPAFYFPVAKWFALYDIAFPNGGGDQVPMTVVVKAKDDPYALTPTVRQAVARIDRDLPIFGIQTLQDLAFDRLGSRRFAMSLFGLFAGLALLLGAVGIYGVMSFGVAQRSRELGVRLALGASRGSVLRMVLYQGIRLTAPGVAIGLAVALATSRLLGNMLFGVTPLDPLTYGLVALVLALVCLLATYLPALRATRVDPLTSIRNE